MTLQSHIPEIRHNFAEPGASLHHHVDGPAVRGQGVAHVVDNLLILVQAVCRLETQELGGGSDGHPRQELVHIVGALQGKGQRSII